MWLFFVWWRCNNLGVSIQLICIYFIFGEGGLKANWSIIMLTFCFSGIGRTLIPRYFRSIFEGGVTDLYFILKHPKESFHNTTITLDCDQAMMVTHHGKPMFTKVRIMISPQSTFPTLHTFFSNSIVFLYTTITLDWDQGGFDPQANVAESSKKILGFS